jgi:hypothetical protein
MRKLPIAFALAASTAVGAFSVSTPARAQDRHDEWRQERRDDYRDNYRDHYRDEHREEAGWVKLGDRRVDFRHDHDVIDVGRHDGRFTKLRLRVLEGDLELYHMRVVMDHGEVFTPETRIHFTAKDHTHVIDLPGDARRIERVEFSYRSENPRVPCVVELIGKEVR